MAKKSQASATWQNRIVGEGVERADQLLQEFALHANIAPFGASMAFYAQRNQVGQLVSGVRIPVEFVKRCDVMNLHVTAYFRFLVAMLTGVKITLKNRASYCPPMHTVLDFSTQTAGVSGITVARNKLSTAIAVTKEMFVEPSFERENRQGSAALVTRDINPDFNFLYFPFVSALLIAIGFNPCFSPWFSRKLLAARIACKRLSNGFRLPRTLTRAVSVTKLPHAPRLYRNRFIALSAIRFNRHFLTPIANSHTSIITDEADYKEGAFCVRLAYLTPEGANNGA